MTIDRPDFPQIYYFFYNIYNIFGSWYTIDMISSRAVVVDIS